MCLTSHWSDSAAHWNLRTTGLHDQYNSYLDRIRGCSTWEVVFGHTWECQLTWWVCFLTWRWKPWHRTSWKQLFHFASGNPSLLLLKILGFCFVHFVLFPTDNKCFCQCRSDQKRGGTTSRTQRIGKRHLHLPPFLCLLRLCCLWLPLSMPGHRQHLHGYWPWAPLNAADTAPHPSAPTLHLPWLPLCLPSSLPSPLASKDRVISVPIRDLKSS